MAFYTGGEIRPLVAKIKSSIESIDLTSQEDIASLDSPQKESAEKLRDEIERQARWQDFAGSHKVMFLSGEDDSETKILPKSIINDQKDKNGRPTPFTFGQRYVTLDSLMSANKTSELESC